MKLRKINESKQLNEAPIPMTFDLYNVEEDGLPRIDEPFIAYSIRQGKIGVFRRLDKNEYQDSLKYLSGDGELYSNVSSDNIYPIIYDSYIYANKLNLKSASTIKQETDKLNADIKDVKECFIKTFGSRLGTVLGNIFSKPINNKINPFPFNVAWNQPFGTNAVKYPLKGVDINTAFTRSKLDSLTNKLITENVSKKDIIEIYESFLTIKWPNRYTQEDILKQKDIIKNEINKLKGTNESMNKGRKAHMKLNKTNEGYIPTEDELIKVNQKEVKSKIKKTLTPIIDASEDIIDITAKGEELMDPIVDQPDTGEATLVLGESVKLNESPELDTEDDLSEVVTSEETEEVKEVGEVVALSSVLSDLIKDEWEAIDAYHSAIATIEYEFDNTELIDILNDIVEEEMIHVGQLEKAVQMINPTAIAIEDGKQEAEEVIADAPVEELPIDELEEPIEESLTEDSTKEYKGFINELKADAKTFLDSLDADNSIYTGYMREVYNALAVTPDGDDKKMYTYNKGLVDAYEDLSDAIDGHADVLEVFELTKEFKKLLRRRNLKVNR